MLVPMHLILKHAMQEQYGVAAPNVYDAESVGACFEAAMELRAPMIVAVGGRFDLELMGDVTRHYAKRHPEVPVALNLDHGATFEMAVSAIKAGFTSIMVDRSQAPLEDNIRETAEIVRMAHAVGVTVEGEIGHVGQGLNYREERQKGLTETGEAVEYWRRTGVDCLAIAIGTAHGHYAGVPCLDFDRLVSIREAVDVPLVLHGGSSTGDENLSKAVRLGITKVNLSTDLLVAGGRAARQHCDRETNPKIRDIVSSGRQGYKSELIRYMRLFGEEDRW